MKKIISIGFILFLFVFTHSGYTGKVKDKSKKNKHGYVASEIIVKLKNSLNIITLDSNGIAKTGLESINEINFRHKITSINKLLKKRKKANKRTNKKADIIFSDHGLDRIYILKANQDIDITKIINELNSDPNVDYAEPNYIYHSNATYPSDTYFDSLYGLHNTGQTGGITDADINAPEAWDIQTGNINVLVAVIDSGVDYNHTDLSANIWANQIDSTVDGIDQDGNGLIDDIRGWDFANNDNDPYDDNSHGTHCAGTIGAVGNNGVGVTGVNWNVTILPIKFLNSFGNGTTANAVKAIEYATLMGAHIMNNSWGGGSFSLAMRDAISAANDAGILFVAAAGNDNLNNDDTPHYPASYDIPNVISVAATTDNDQKLSLSNYGSTSVDIGAPGKDVYSTIPGPPKYYGHKSGTSMAASHVSGVAALIKAQFPGITSLSMKFRLMGGAVPISSLSGITVTGGRLNAFNSLVDDIIPPNGIIDLDAVNPTYNSITLQWTATGDDDLIGTASFYDIRYSTSYIDTTNWNNLKQIIKPNPNISGFPETFTINNLLSETIYYCAIKVIDNAGNFSGLSNVDFEMTTIPLTIFEDDMESGLNGWSTAGVNNLWELGTPTYSSVSAYSGSNVWGTDLDGNYGFDLALEDLTSQSIDLNTVSSASLTFQNWYTTEPNYDGGVVLVSTDYGTTWQYVDYDGYDVKLIGSNPLPNEWKAFSGSSGGWRKEIIDLTPYVGNIIKLRFEFASDNSVNGFPGWYIDDISVIGQSIGLIAPTVDAGSDQTGGVGIPVNFDGSGSYDIGGSIVSYDWAFGDGTYETGILTSHTYNSLNTYNAVLTVTDNDGLTGSDTCLITIDFIPNNPPVADYGTTSTDEDTPVIIAVLSNDTDLDGDSLFILSTTNGSNGAVIENIDSTLTYTPDADFNGSDSFTYTISDGNGGTDSATVDVTVNPVNDAPVINPVVPNLATNEDIQTQIDLTAYETDTEDTGMDLDWSISGVDTALYSASLNVNTDLLTITPVSNQNGSDTLTLTLTDSGVLTDTQDVTVTINPVNDVPLANDDIALTAEDTGVDINVLDNDTDTELDALVVSEVGPALNGTVSINVDNTIKYIPDLNFNGSDNFLYKISDGNGGSNTANVDVFVGDVNDPPVANGDTALTDEDIPVNINVLANDTDADGDILTVTSAGTAVYGTTSVNPDYMITYTPNINYNGSDSFTYTISDGNGGTDIAFVNVTVNPFNDPPVANDDTTITNEDTPVTIDVLANDYANDNEPFFIINFTQGNDGSVSDNGSGALIYTPNINFNGNDNFFYEISDGNGGTDIAKVDVTVDPVNDPPVADANGPYAGTINSPVLFDGSNSYDPDINPIIYIWDFGDGNIDIGINPSHIYTAAGTYIVTLIVNDGFIDSEPYTTIANIESSDIVEIIKASYKYRNRTLKVSALSNDPYAVLTVVRSSDGHVYGTMVKNKKGIHMFKESHSSDPEGEITILSSFGGSADKTVIYN